MEEVGAGAFPVGALLVVEAAAGAARPCRAAGRTSRPAPSLMLGACRAGAAAGPSLRRRLRADAAAARALLWRLRAGAERGAASPDTYAL